MVASLHNQKESSFGNNVRETLQVASTLWPISFAAVLGPFLKTMALYRAEKGSTLGALEFLSTSQTTMSAFINLALFGGTYFWTVAIVVIWCLSPLGGQAAVRSIGLFPNSTIIQIPAMHYLGSNISDMNPFYRGGFPEGDMGIFRNIGIREELIFNLRNNIASVFSTPDVLVSHADGSSDGFDDAVQRLGGKWQAARVGQQDRWRNVRVPFLQLLPHYNSEHPEDWVEVPTDQVVSYVSLIGIPIRGGSVFRAGNSTMMVRSHYMTVSCGPAFKGSAWLTPTAHKLLFHDVKHENSLTSQYESSFPIRTWPNIFLDTVNDTKTLEEHARFAYYPLNDTEPTTKLKLILGGPCPDDPLPRVFLRTCDVSTSYVDVEVRCTRLTAFDDQNCRAARLRHTPGFPVSGNLTALSNFAILNGITWQFPFATSDYDIAVPGLIEMYLKNPPQTLARSPLTNNYPGCFNDVPLDAFEGRFATALNTFVTATFNATVLTGADGMSLENRNIMWRNTTATWSEFTESIYALHKPWFSVWLVSTIVLFVIAIANVAIRAIIIAPDFLSGVAGLTRDSPFIDVPQDRSGESGSDRLRRWKKTEVRICDVQSTEDVGRIALTTDLNAGRLAWRRAYE
ncbi:hypothetical protein N0V84_008108 [Fusarium piperis]|uniref:Uncharacterized protein n=1 Tax=Fusarium piperis TaxID=1435070 RepID=A0A9W8W8V8_9HYPO|nr:hypothetical protein N0V84_008108 [Fusarium piperis]